LLDASILCLHHSLGD